MATNIKKGQTITLSTSEVAYKLTGDLAFPLTTVNILLVSGTLQYTVVPGLSETDILDSTYATYSTAGDKIVFDMSPNSTLRMRCSSAGVVIVNF